MTLLVAGCADFRRGPYWDEDTSGDGGGVDGGNDGGDDSGTAPPGTGTDGSSFAIDIYPLVRAGCERCHSPTGVANGTEFIVEDDVDATYQSTLAFVETSEPSSSRVLSKATGAGHTGGVIFDERSQEYQTILQWIEQGALP